MYVFNVFDFELRLHACEFAVLAPLSDADLNHVIRLARRDVYSVPSLGMFSGQYPECQIHGELRFDQDIDTLVVAHQHAANQALCAKIEQFCERNHISVVYMEADAHGGAAAAGYGGYRAGHRAAPVAVPRAAAAAVRRGGKTGKGARGRAAAAGPALGADAAEDDDSDEEMRAALAASRALTPPPLGGAGAFAGASPGVGAGRSGRAVGSDAAAAVPSLAASTAVARRRNDKA
jgi:hypothetical protein